MADIQAFRGLRFDLSKVGSLSEVVAPPYDVIGVESRDALYGRNEFNVVRLILNRGDNLLPEQTVYERAAEHLKNWKTDGVLKPDGVGAIYVYHQTFEVDGIEYTRRGFISRVRIEPFGEGNIYPHEKTHSKVKEDRSSARFPRSLGAGRTGGWVMESLPNELLGRASLGLRGLRIIPILAGRFSTKSNSLITSFELVPFC